ncbi:MAG: hypothetical protein QNJ92_12535 [Alphaproteobacteria bacterium]|nr:hypothetical protein [Alphaproteobacteria bacterium]
MTREIRNIHIAAAVGLVLMAGLMMWSGSTRALDQDALVRYRQAHFDKTLTEFCGVNTDRAAEGFLWLRDDLIASGGITEELARRARESARRGFVDTYYEHLDAGTEQDWCEEAGADAARRLATYAIEARIKGTAEPEGGQPAIDEGLMVPERSVVVEGARNDAEALELMRVEQPEAEGGTGSEKPAKQQRSPMRQPAPGDQFTASEK